MPKQDIRLNYGKIQESSLACQIPSATQCMPLLSVKT